MLARAARQLVWRYLSCVRERESVEGMVGEGRMRGGWERRVGGEGGRKRGR